MRFNGCLTKSHFALFAALIASGCRGDPATAPVPPDPSLRLVSVSSEFQTGVPGDELDAPEVEMRDQNTNRISGVTVSFSVTGGGSVANLSDVSAGGFAGAGKWTPGPGPGLNTVVASAHGVAPVTFTAKILDAGAVTRYDLRTSIPDIVSGSFALGQKGIFELNTVETSDVLPGAFPDREQGTYTLTGTDIVLTFPLGVVEQGTLVGDTLTIVHTKTNWVGSPPQQWSFVKRQ